MFANLTLLACLSRFIPIFFRFALVACFFFLLLFARFFTVLILLKDAIFTYCWSSLYLWIEHLCILMARNVGVLMIFSMDTEGMVNISLHSVSLFSNYQQSLCQ